MITSCRGRLNHGRHFTFRSLHGDVAITLISDGIEGAMATDVHPLVARGSWLQMYLGRDNGKKVLKDITPLLPSNTTIPVSLEWPELNLKVTVIGN